MKKTAIVDNQKYAYPNNKIFNGFRDVFKSDEDQNNNTTSNNRSRNKMLMLQAPSSSQLSPPLTPQKSLTPEPYTPTSSTGRQNKDNLVYVNNYERLYDMIVAANRDSCESFGNRSIFNNSKIHNDYSSNVPNKDPKVNISHFLRIFFHSNQQLEP